MFQWTPPTCGRHFKSITEHLMSLDFFDGEMAPGPWADMDRSSQAVLPVLIRHANGKGISYPSECLIAAKSGLLDRKTVRRATKKLAERDIITIKKRITRAGHKQKNLWPGNCYQ